MAKKSRKPQPQRSSAAVRQEYDPVADYLARLIVIEGELRAGVIADDAKALEEAVASAMDGWQKPALGAGFPADLAHSLVESASRLPPPQNVTEGLPLALSAVRLYPRCVRAYAFLSEIAGAALGTDWDFTHTAAVFATRELRLVGPQTPRGEVAIEALGSMVFELVTARQYETARPWVMLMFGLAENVPVMAWLGGAAVAASLDDEALAARVATTECSRTDRPPVWLFAQALALFQLDGDTEKSRAVRERAMAAVPAVGRYLSGKTKKPRTPPRDYEAMYALFVYTILEPAVDRLPGARAWFAAASS